jgi:hypothetical protein
MTIYQLDARTIEAGEVTKPLGFDVELDGPACERLLDSLLFHEYEVRFSTPGSALVLRPAEAGSLTYGNDGTELHIQTGPLEASFTHLIPRGTVIHDLSEPSLVHFVAWPDSYGAD